MAHAIKVYDYGGPEVLKYEAVELPEPGAGEVLIKHRAVGLNYIDTYHRTGLYPVPGFPFTPGLEAAGEILELGTGVTDLAVGDRIAYATAPLGAYATERVMPAARLVKLPNGIDYASAASMMLQGLTSWYLCRKTYPIQKGDTVLIHAVAGGVGLILCQWAKDLGATVIGTTSSDAKAAAAKEAGCDHVILYTQENFTDRVKEITDGVGVACVYDGVGKDTFEGSLDCLKRLGTMITFGNASGAVPPVNPLALTDHGSIMLARPKLVDYTATTEELREGAAALFDVVARGAVKVSVNQTYPLADASQAHTDLEGRKTTGSTVLLP